MRCLFNFLRCCGVQGPPKFPSPSSALEARLVGKSIVFCLQISLLSADYHGDVILKVVVKRGLESVPRNNKI